MATGVVGELDVEGPEGRAPRQPGAAFRSLADLSHQCHQETGQLWRNIAGSAYETLGPTIMDQQARFNVWAANIGAMKETRSASSLDARLGSAETMRQSVAEGLGRLDQALKRALRIVSGELPNRTNAAETDPSDAILAQITKERLSVATGSRAGPASAEKPRTTELAEVLLNVQSAIKHLFELSVLIRRDRPRGCLPTHKSHDFQVEAEPDITNVRDKFPKLKRNPRLAEKLGVLVAQRREYIRYRQNHRKHLATVVASEIDQVGDRATTKATTFQEADSLDHGAAMGDVLDDGRSERTFASDATSFATTAAGLAGLGRKIPELTAMWLEGVQLEYDAHIECPYCRTIQSMRNRRQWKQHVYNDLQLYACTFPDCKEPAFGTAREWFRHEQDQHRRVWQCHLCDHQCRSTEELGRHFDSAHAGNVLTRQRSVFAKGCEKPLLHFGPGACHFCDDWKTSGDSQTSQNLNQFRSHLGNHLRELAREALPLSIEGLDVKDDLDLDEVDDDSADNNDADTEADGDEDDNGVANSGKLIHWLMLQSLKKRLRYPGPVFAITARPASGWSCVFGSDHEVCGYPGSTFQELRSHYEKEHPLVPGTDRICIGYACTFCGRVRPEIRYACPKGCETTTSSTYRAIGAFPEGGFHSLVKSEADEGAIGLGDGRSPETSSHSEWYIGDSVPSGKSGLHLSYSIREDIGCVPSNPEMQYKSTSFGFDDTAYLLFKDAVGRKFKIPISVIDTWPKMKNYISDSFRHLDRQLVFPDRTVQLIDVVDAGHYTLFDSNEAIIESEKWSTLLKPGVHVYMRFHLSEIGQAVLVEKGKEPLQSASRGEQTPRSSGARGAYDTTHISEPRLHPSPGENTSG